MIIENNQNSLENVTSHFKNEPIEIWRPVKGYEGKYEISNLGRVKSFLINKSGSIMGVTLRTGYPSVILSKNARGKKKNWKHHRIHRLLAIAFIARPKGKHHVNHVDGNPLNFSLDNLEWCTHSENMKHRSTVNAYKEIVEYIKNNSNPLSLDSFKFINSKYSFKKIKKL